MINLVIKDIMVQKKTFIFSVLYALFAVTALANSFTARGAYMFGSISIAYLFIMYSNSYDDKNKCEIVLNSLPIQRKHIVIAKYLSLFLFCIIGIVITGLMGAITKEFLPKLNMRFILFEDIASIIISIGLMYSLYYPLYFKYGLHKMRFFNMILYLFFLFAPIIIAPQITNNPDNPFLQKIMSFIKGSPDFAVQLFILAAVILIILISLILSIKFYENKDF